MTGRLVYVVGPSGAGKDSVMEYARTRLPASAGVIFTRRFITREPASGGEQHIPVSATDFERMRLQGHFALNWDANGLRYGIGREIRTWIDLGFHVVANGSREYLPTALKHFPDALVICITASIETIRSRLNQRQRESDHDIEKRIQRTTVLSLPSGCRVTTIINEGALEAAGDTLITSLLALNPKIPA